MRGDAPVGNISEYAVESASEEGNDYQNGLFEVFNYSFEAPFCFWSLHPAFSFTQPFIVNSQLVSNRTLIAPFKWLKWGLNGGNIGVPVCIVNELNEPFFITRNMVLGSL